MRRKFLIVTAVLAGFVPSVATTQTRTGADGPAPHFATANCVAGGYAAKFESAGFDFQSAAFRNIPGTQITFNQGKNGCVLVQFTAESNTDGAIQLQVIMDGEIQATPSEVFFVRNNADLQAHAFNFFFTDVPAGSHRVAVQARLNGGTTGGFAFRNTIVFHTP